MEPKKIYAMPIEERDGQWWFRVVIDTRNINFGPYSTVDSALAIRKAVRDKPGNWKELGGRRSEAY